MEEDDVSGEEIREKRKQRERNKKAERAETDYLPPWDKQGGM